MSNKKYVRCRFLEGSDKDRVHHLDEETPVMIRGELMFLRRVPADSEFDIHWESWVRARREDSTKYVVSFETYEKLDTVQALERWVKNYMTSEHKNFRCEKK